MLLGPIFIASISVILTAIALFVTAAIMSVDGARKRYERTASPTEGSEQRPSANGANGGNGSNGGNGTTSTGVRRAPVVFATAELADWHFPGPQSSRAAQASSERAA